MATYIGISIGALAGRQQGIAEPASRSGGPFRYRIQSPVENLENILILLQAGQISRANAIAAIQDPAIQLPALQGEPLPADTIATEMWKTTFPGMV